MGETEFVLTQRKILFGFFYDFGGEGVCLRQCPTM